MTQEASSLQLGDVMLVVAHTEGPRSTSKNASLLSILTLADFAERDKTRVICANVHAGDVLILRCVKRDDDKAADDDDDDDDDRAAAAQQPKRSLLDEAISLGDAKTLDSLLADAATTKLELVAAYERKTVADLVASVVARTDRQVGARRRPEPLRAFRFG